MKNTLGKLQKALKKQKKAEKKFNKIVIKGKKAVIPYHLMKDNDVCIHNSFRHYTQL